MIGSGWVLGASLFIGVGWLYILNRLQVRAGEDRADADRTTLWSLGVAVLVFVMLRAIPGDQVTASLGTEAAAANMGVRVIM